MNDTLAKLYVRMQTVMVREEGQDLVEYALVIGLISIFLVASLQGVANSIKGIFSTISAVLSSAA
jgi:pilus assembly protein Flp/PilA